TVAAAARVADQKRARQRPRWGDRGRVTIPSAAQFGVDVVDGAVVVVVAKTCELAAYAIRQRRRGAADDQPAIPPEQPTEEPTELAQLVRFDVFQDVERENAIEPTGV